MATMTNEQKYRRLVDLLVKRTAARTAKWEPTVEDGVFQISLPDFSVQISKREDREGSTDVVFNIVDQWGTKIDAFTDSEVGSSINVNERSGFYENMLRLYTDARRTALGVDSALDKLLEELGKDPATGQ